jgi:hypothetical protein
MRQRNLFDRSTERLVNSHRFAHRGINVTIETFAKMLAR